MAKKKLLIIAGHGEGDPGACSIWGQEADYTRELATLVKKSIGNKMATVMYDQNKNCYAQSKKGKVPDYASYDATLEIHFNAKAKKDPYGDGSYTGIGGYVHPSNDAGRKVAEAIMSEVTALGFKEWGIFDSTGLLNLNRAQSQGACYFLLETAFIDDGDDMAFYTEHKEAFAQAIAQGVLSGVGSKSTASLPDKEEYYRVRKTWEDAKSQTFAGTKEGAIKCCPVGYSVYDPDGKCIFTNEVLGTQAYSLKGCAEAEYIEAVGKLYTEDEKKNGILACVSLAQSILESGYGQTDLAQIGNNMHGMKCRLSGNVWTGTTWNGDSFYEKESPEVENGVTVMRKSQFRCYGSIEESIADHSAYLLNAPNGNKLRYAGLQDEADYRKAIRIIKDGGYATDPDYVDKIVDIIERWDLTRFNASSADVKAEEETGAEMENTTEETCEELGIYTTVDILSIYEQPSSAAKVVGYIQEAAGHKKDYHIVKEQDGFGLLKSGAGWVNLKYTKKWLYAVQTTCDDLRIRKSASANAVIVGHILEPEGKKKIYHIDKEKDGWGHLSSGAGWVSLEYVVKIPT